MNEPILYTTEDGRSQIRLRADQQTVWLTQLEIAELFDATKQNISLHLKNIFEDGELDPVATVKESLTVQTEGTRKVQMENRTNALYLDYDQRRKQEEATLADQLDEAELKALENTLKRRPKP